jgi:sugar/nucleoside kinase (ribokinase family)
MDVLATGYPSIDYIARVSHSPSVGETALLRTVPDEFRFGGCGNNVAVALTKLGFRTGVAMILGDDRFGDDYMRYLMGLGINITNVIRLRGEKTSRSYLFLNQDDQHQNFFFPGASDAWKDELKLNRPEEYRFALVTVGPFHYNRQYVEQLKTTGVPLVWELKPDIHAYPPEMMGDFLAASTYVVMNHIEADYIMKSMGFSKVEECLSDKTKVAIVTRGADGSQVYTSEGMSPIPAVPPKQIVDPTGAGDGFTAGFMAGLLKNATPKDAAQLGAVMASFVLEILGCQTNLPTWEQALARYQEHFGPFEAGS